MHRWCFISFVFYLLAETALSSDNYMHANLEDFCYRDGVKKEVGFRSNVPHRYVFNTTLTSTFQCHLELELKTTHLGSGFSVFIESMHLETNEDCTKDWLQFGRDVLFITTKKSKKFCQKIPPLTPKFKQNSLHDGFEPDPYPGSRFYKEMGNEMDVWIQIQPGYQKELVLVITPHISCTKNNRKFRACPNSSECVAKHLFCDGRVNCITNSLDEDSRFCPSIVPGGIGSSGLGLPLVLIISVATILFFIFIFFLVKECISRLRRTTMNNSAANGGGERFGGLGMQQGDHGMQQGDHGMLPLGPDQSLLEPPQRGRVRGGGVVGLEERLAINREESGIPASPPPYSEVTGIPDEPPKYDDIIKTSQTIV